jgi:hypothetical protein
MLEADCVHSTPPINTSVADGLAELKAPTPNAR